MPSIRSLFRPLFRPLFHSLRPHPAWLIAVLVFAAGANHAWAAAGRFQFAFGDIRIVAKDGRERLAHKGDEINEGESIVSAKGASAQLLMVDGGIVAIRQDTHLRIDEYKFSGKEDGTERGFFALLKGGLRSITGLIGKLNREHYRIKTPAATIGIRGTDSETIHLLAGPGLPPDMQPGTYNKVNTGATVVNGTVVGPNQVAYAPSLDIPAIILPKMPSLFEPPKASQDSRRDNQKQEAQGEKEDAAKNGEAAPSQSTGEQTGTTGPAAETGTTDGASAPTADTTTTTLPPPSGATTTVSLPPPPPPTPTIVNTTTTTGGLASGTNLFNAPIGYGGVGGDISMRTDYINATPVTGNWAGNGGIVIEGTNQIIVIDATTNIPVLIAETNPNGNTMQYTSGTAQFVDGGMRAVGGTTVSWGRYVGADQFVDNQGVRDPVTMNLMFTPQAMSYTQAANHFATAPTTNYTLTTPFAGNVVDQAGNLYTPTSGTLSIATGATANGVALRLIGSTWDLSYGGSLSQFYGGNCTVNGPCGLPLTAASGSMFANSIVTGTGINTKGEAAGVLVGPNAGGALISFSANTTTGQSLLGTTLLVAPGY